MSLSTPAPSSEIREVTPSPEISLVSHTPTGATFFVNGFTDMRSKATCEPLAELAHVERG